jgi:hypothetical protein
MTQQRTLAELLLDAADRPGPDLAAPAFLVARVEYPRLDAGPYLDRLDAMGDQASLRIAEDPGHDAPLEARIDSLNRSLFRDRSRSASSTSRSRDGPASVPRA